jgi:hypothetical protein
MAPAYRTRFAKPALNGLAIFSFTLAEQPHLHQELDDTRIIRNTADANTGAQPSAVSPLTDAGGRRSALEHAKTG